MADSLPEPDRFETASGTRIYRLPLEAFPGFWAYAYLAIWPGFQVLIDAGSGFGSSNEHLEAGLAWIREQAQEPVELATLTHVLITHGHIDHFGGLAFVQPRSPARIGVHELDLRNLTNYEERLVVVARRLEAFLIEAGAPPERREELLQMYLLPKSLFQSVSVDFTFEAAGMRFDRLDLLHVPGHGAGHVILRLDDYLFTGDHLLAEISPHQAPESLTLHTGLSHYLQSLERTREWAAGARIGLGGHKAAITDIPHRIDEIVQLHESRLQEVAEILGEPHTIAEVSSILFGAVSGYNALLALEEAGAHVEYLYQRGRLAIENLKDIENRREPLPIYYQRIAYDQFVRNA